MVPLLSWCHSWNNTASVDEKVLPSPLYSDQALKISQTPPASWQTWTLKGCCQPWSRMTFDEPQKVEIEDTLCRRNTVTDEEEGHLSAKLKNHNQRENISFSHACSKGVRWTIKKYNFVQHFDGDNWNCQNHEVMREEQKRQSECIDNIETTNEWLSYRWINHDVSSHWKKMWPVSWRSWQTLIIAAVSGVAQHWVDASDAFKQSVDEKSAYWLDAITDETAIDDVKDLINVKVMIQWKH